MRVLMIASGVRELPLTNTGHSMEILLTECEPYAHHNMNSWNSTLACSM